MGLIDTFTAEDRIEVKFSDFYNMMKGVAQRDTLMNGIACDVPHRYLREMMTGDSEAPAPEPVELKPGGRYLLPVTIPEGQRVTVGDNVVRVLTEDEGEYVIAHTDALVPNPNARKEEKADG